METENKVYPDMCICCGEPIPEGRMICYACENGRNKAAPGKQSKTNNLISEVFGFHMEEQDEH